MTDTEERLCTFEACDRPGVSRLVDYADGDTARVLLCDDCRDTVAAAIASPFTSVLVSREGWVWVTPQGLVPA